MRVEDTHSCAQIGFYFTSFVKISTYKVATCNHMCLYKRLEHCIFYITAPRSVQYATRAEIPWWWCARWSLAPLWYRFLDDSYVDKKIHVMESRRWDSYIDIFDHGGAMNIILPISLLIPLGMHNHLVHVFWQHKKFRKLWKHPLAWAISLGAFYYICQPCYWSTE